MRQDIALSNNITPGNFRVGHRMALRRIPEFPPCPGEGVSPVEKAILIATTGDCFGKFPLDQEVTILDDSHQISPSDYALPANVRAATMLAREKSMGYAPVNVKDTGGTRYTLSSQMHFFEENGVAGPEILLDDSTYHGKNIVHPDWAEMYLICDMFNAKSAVQPAR